MDGPDLRTFYFGMTALCGSITALAYMKYKEMGWLERGLNIFIGLAFSFLVGPWAGHSLMGINENDARALCIVTYMFAAGWPLILPRMIEWAKRAIPGQDEQDKQP